MREKLIGKCQKREKLSVVAILTIKIVNIDVKEFYSMKIFLMMVIFSSKHGGIGKSGLVWIIGIHFIFIFLVILGFF
jgi:hypothetical protein